MAQIKPLPALWLLSDERNDAALEESIAHLPQGSGFVFRHYHLEPEARRERFLQLLPLLLRAEHWVILSDSFVRAQEWGAHGVYGALGSVHRADQRWIATAHDEDEIAIANEHGADAVMISPVFPTRSHPGAATLGVERFHKLAALSKIPVIALGGMNQARAKELDWPRWAAIDGLS
ncbi:thiamine phosphate synthase [Erythrobacter sp. KY5]|uniref:thiamine phosphate synthase n=1 Tax=Erythrobacter sp. KY5 TaxID=2011159 RepID=UPI000DBF00C3|nr:thiamine phosphate synthase [Erythrobacter sp. KY5]AWW73440.1 thiamine phosphate synthase [Erythrobacter sp. KY5]